MTGRPVSGPDQAVRCPGDDPREQTDLFEKERRIAAELSAALGRHIQRGGEVPWQPE